MVLSCFVVQEAYECASLAVGCMLQVVDEVCGGRSQNGVAIVRYVSLSYRILFHLDYSFLRVTASLHFLSNIFVGGRYLSSVSAH